MATTTNLTSCGMSMCCMLLQCNALCYTMPISSAATVSQAQGSYLKRYFSHLPQDKRKDLENFLEAECAFAEKEEAPPKGSQMESSGDTKIDETPSRKSSTCTVL